MKWAKPVGSTQGTVDGRYMIVQANTQHWVSYRMGHTVAKDLGTSNSDEKARELCEAHERGLIQQRKSA